VADHPQSSERKRRRAIARTVRDAADPYRQFLETLSPSAAATVQHYGCARVKKVRRWYVLEVPADGVPQLHERRTFAEARALLAERDGTECWLYVFYGVRALLTAEWPRSVIHPNGSVYRLRPPVDTLRVSPTDYAGTAWSDEETEGAEELEFVDDDDDGEEDDDA